MAGAGHKGKTTKHSQEQERRKRDARNNLYSEFSNASPAVSVDYLSKDLLKCTRCGLRKPDEMFHKNKYNAHRRERQCQCKECRRELMVKRWANISPEDREKHRISSKKSYQKHKDKRDAWQIEYRKKNKARKRNR